MSVKKHRGTYFYSDLCPPTGTKWCAHRWDSWASTCTSCVHGPGLSRCNHLPIVKWMMPFAELGLTRVVNLASGWTTKYGSSATGTFLSIPLPCSQKGTSQSGLAIMMVGRADLLPQRLAEGLTFFPAFTGKKQTFEMLKESPKTD